MYVRLVNLITVYSPMTPIVSNMFCSSVWETLSVRKRPQVANGGGFVVTDGSQRVVFRADGCGILGKKGEIVVKDSDNKAILLIHRQHVQLWSTHKRWKCYTFDLEGKQKPVFTLKEPNSIFANSNSRSSGIRIQVHAAGAGESIEEWEFQVEGSFSNKSCSIIDSMGNTAAQIEVNKEVVGSKDLYDVLVSPGMDQAVVIGVIAVLDYISHESTTC